MGDKVSGQALVERIMGFIGKYVEVPGDLPVSAEGQRLVLALWVLHTWVYERFAMTPYLTVTASVKQAGKTLCMEVLATLARGAEMLATLRPLALVRAIKMTGGQVTLFLDEAEKLSSGAVGDLRSIFTTGAYPGGVHAISKGEEWVKFPTFAPKCFALIGDVMDVVRDRSIVVHLDRLTPKEDFRANRTEARAEADQILMEMREVFAASSLEKVQPSMFGGRDREVWTPLFSLAATLKLNRATMELLVSAATDLVNMKKLPARTHYNPEEEERAAAAAMAERAIADLAAVLPEADKEHTGHVWSAIAVERMKAIPAGPWRTYRGVGLTADDLAGLIKVFGVKSKVVPMKKGRGEKQLNGYRRDDVLAKVPGGAK